MTDKSSLMEFPCNFPIKIIGVQTDSFINEASAVVLKHFPDTKSEHITNKLSENGTYTAITATVLAHNQKSLDALYSELTLLPGIKMVL